MNDHNVCMPHIGRMSPETTNSNNKDISIFGDSNDTSSIRNDSDYNNSTLRSFNDAWAGNGFSNDYDNPTSFLNELAWLSSFNLKIDHIICQCLIPSNYKV